MPVHDDLKVTCNIAGGLPGQDHADIHQGRHLLRRHAKAPHGLQGDLLHLGQLLPQPEVRAAIMARLLWCHGKCKSFESTVDVHKNYKSFSL
jgi:hypothetical protein